MTHKLDGKELVSFKKMRMANDVMMDTLAQILFEKGVFTEEEFFTKLKDVQAQYDAGKRHAG